MLFFGVGTGRCGTMTLANLIDAEDGVACLHEGRFRDREETGEQWLSFLTLQNLHAYHHPEEAESLLRRARRQMPELREQHGLRMLGDVAYFYAPFVRVIPRVFPEARLLVVVRDGRDFVRSAYTAENPDPTPVGWPDPRPLSKTEHYVSLGRLRPGADDPLHEVWPTLTPVAKNAWLWAETNRLILDGLAEWQPERVLLVRFEEFFADSLAGYERVRDWLGLEPPVSDRVRELLRRPINARSHPILPKWTEWDETTMNEFLSQATPVMERLAYL